jgi:hypothetical protein
MVIVGFRVGVIKVLPVRMGFTPVMTTSGGVRGNAPLHLLLLALCLRLAATRIRIVGR